MRILLLLIASLSYITVGYGANILYASDVVSPSHKIFNFALVEGLVKRGHNVTFLQPLLWTNLGKNLKNYHPIYMEGHEEHPDLEPASIGDFSTMDVLLFMMGYGKFCCEGAVKSESVDVLLNYPKDYKFDLIIFDATVSKCLYPLIKRFNYPPTIAVTPFLLPYYLSLTFGNSLYPSYLPYFSLKYTDEMSYPERVANYFWMNLDWLFRNIYYYPAIEGLAKQKFDLSGTNLNTLEEHISLLFCNLDPVYHYPQPLTPNIIPVAGLHLRAAKPLPKDLQEIADDAKYGLILFALGSNVRSDQMEPKKIQSLLDAFAKVKQTVLWKFESNLTRYSIPNNVHIRQWLPQTDLLAHPNTKLFISHGGALSMIEAAYFGIPVLGIPFIVDQYVNVLMLEQKKIGVLMEYNSITAENFVAKMNEILENPSYTKAVKDVSKRMRSQPQTPLERAIFWAEYAIDNNGTHFLDPRSRNMSRFVSTSTDVQVTFILVILSFIYCVNKICRCLLSRKKDSLKEKVH